MHLYCDRCESMGTYKVLTIHILESNFRKLNYALPPNSNKGYLTQSVRINPSKDKKKYILMQANLYQKFTYSHIKAYLKFLYICYK